MTTHSFSLDNVVYFWKNKTFNFPQNWIKIQLCLFKKKKKKDPNNVKSFSCKNANSHNFINIMLLFNIFDSVYKLNVFETNESAVAID